MSNVIQIKRSAATGAPASLLDGEMAYSHTTNKLFIGDGSTVKEIGGSTFTGLLSATAGTATASKAVILDSNAHINSVHTSSLALAASGAAGTPVTSIETSVSVASTDAQLPTSKAVYDFVSSFAPSSSFGGLTDVALTSLADANLAVYESASSKWKNVAMSGDVTITAAGVAAIAAGVIVNNDINASAAIARSKLAVGSANHVVINAGDGSFSSEASLAVTRGGTGLTSAPSLNNLLIGNGSSGYTLGSLLGTTNRATVTKTGNDLVISLPDTVSGLTSVSATSMSTTAGMTVGGDLDVAGNLTVSGTLTTLDTANLAVEDPLITVGSGNAADINDLGIVGAYTSGGVKYTGLFRDATDGKYRLFTGLAVAPTTTVNTADGTYATATLVANIETASLTATGGTLSGITISSLAAGLAVADGGTGVSAFTANGVFYGATTSSLGFATGSPGGVLQISAGGAPTFAGLDGGTF